MKKKQRIKLGNSSKKFAIIRSGHLIIANNSHSKSLRWTKYYKEVKHTNRIVDAFMKRSIFSVIGSYIYRKNKGIDTQDIYSYSGDQEAHRLLNRSVSETIKECLELKRIQA